MKEIIRRCLHPLAALLVRRRSRPWRFAAGSRCVIVAPHPDDETFGCGGLIATAQAAGVPVAILYLTDGAASHPQHPRLTPATVAVIRQAEAIEAMQRLKVGRNALHFLGIPDGTLSHLSPVDFSVRAQRLADALAPLQATALFLPCRDEGSAEHTGAFEMVQQALLLGQLRPQLFEYPIWARWRPHELVRIARGSRTVWRLAFPALVARKSAAVAANVSQIEATPPWTTSVLPPGFTRCFAASEEFFFER